MTHFRMIFFVLSFALFVYVYLYFLFIIPFSEQKTPVFFLLSMCASNGKAHIDFACLQASHMCTFKEQKEDKTAIPVRS